MVEKKLSDLIPNKYNPREIFRGAAMEELKASMQDGGLIQPILVRPLKNGKWEVVAGMRRFYAAKDLEWESIDCHVRQLNNSEAMLLAYSENVLRENLTPIELGRMYENLSTMLKEENSVGLRKLMQSNGLTYPQKMEKLTHLTYPQIWRYMSLLKLPKELQNLIELNHGDRDKGFAVSYGFELARLPEDKIMEFYEIYNPKDYSFGQYNKKVSEKIAENKLEGEKKRKKLEGNLNKTQLEIKKLIQRQEAFEERINENLEKVDYGDIEEIIEEGNENLEKIEEVIEIEEVKESNYDDIEKAIEFLTKQLEEFQSEEKLDKLAKDIKHYEHQIDDLDILLDRTDKEAISICPYCLAKIDIKIINKRKELFEAEVKNFRDELKEINSTMDFNQNLKKDLKSEYDLLVEILSEIEQKGKEVGDITDAISRL